MGANRRKVLELRDAYEPEQLFNHAVSTYTNIWFRKDRGYAAKVKGRPEGQLSQVLQEIAKDYKVIRTLEKCESSWENLAKDIHQLGRIDDANYIEKVTEFANSHRRAGKKPLSAVSKLLWFRSGAPVKLFDSRAVDALRAMKYFPGFYEYEGFCAAWAKAFDDHRDELFKAIDRLCTNLQYTLVPIAERGRFQTLAATPDFYERVFDQYLWFLGDPSGNESD
jgi:hypothetical protein